MMTHDHGVVPLNGSEAADPALTGGKAAALAVAAAHGLPALGGAVLTSAFSADIDNGADIGAHPAVARVFDLVGGNRWPLVARSSSLIEDTATSSMAGQFEAVIGIEGLDAFIVAVRAVLGSRLRAGAADVPIAVIVQPLIEAKFGGRHRPCRRSRRAAAVAGQRRAGNSDCGSGRRRMGLARGRPLRAGHRRPPAPDPHRGCVPGPCSWPPVSGNFYPLTGSDRQSI